MTPMTDDQLDVAVASFLGWQSTQLEGSPDAQAVAWRIAGARLAPRPRWQRSTAGLVVVGLLVVSLIGAAIITSRPPAPVGPLVNGPIVVSNALGWRTMDASSGAEATVEPCAGLCVGLSSPVLSADGATMFYVVPSPMDGDARPTEPGWSLWRWERGAGTTTSVHVCDLCMISRVVPSPDGRSVALVETSQARPGAAVEVVVVDARTGRELHRSADLRPADFLGPVIPAWDARSRLIVGRNSGDRLVRQRIDMATGVAVDVGQGLPTGLLLNSPDGRGLMLVVGDQADIELLVVDPELRGARPVVRLDTDGIVSGAWAPDGTSFAVMTGTESTGPEFFDYEIAVVDLATGAVARHPTDAAGGELIWLPEDRPSAP